MVVNRFLYTNKFSTLYDWLRRAASRMGVELTVFTNDEILFNIGSPEEYTGERPDFVLFYDKDIRLAEQLETHGFRLFNSARSIELCDDKSLMHAHLIGELPMPDTYCAPFTYENIGYGDAAFVEAMFERLGAPLVIKEVFGSFGQQVYLARTTDEARARLRAIGGKRALFQRFVGSSFGRDLRLNVVGGRVIAAMYRFNEHGDFRANITNGGSMRAHTPTAEQEAMAVRAAELLGLDFCGVDLLFGGEGEPILCEVNSNAHFKSIFDATGVNAADAIMEHIVKTLGSERA